MIPQPEIQILNGLYYTFDEIKCVTYFFNSSLSVSFMVHYKHYSDAGRYTAYIIYLPSIAPSPPYTIYRISGEPMIRSIYADMV